MILRLASILAFAAAAFAQSAPAQPQRQQRDLKLEKIEADLPKPVAVPRSYAVVVGISRYKNLEEKDQLRFAERDAQTIYSALISPEGGSFKAENVHTLLGEKATLANIRREIEDWLPSKAQTGDRVLIYFAGHGFLREGKGYLAPFDFSKDKITATGYPMDDLGRAIGSKIRASYKILLTDACHSGAISPDDTAALNRTLTSLNQSLFSLTASRDREQSFEAAELEGGHGLFTYYTAKGMEGAADLSHDGLVTADELAEYVHTQVREATGGKQNPTSDRGSYDPQMRIAFVPANAAPANPPAPKYGTLIFESNMDEVEIFVDGKSAGVASKGKAFVMPGLPPGEHTIQGVHMGYEPDGPRQQMVYPGEDTTVTIKILIPRRRKQAAADSFNKGLDTYLKRSDFRKAAEYFESALKVEPEYSQAAYYLGLTYNALFEQDKAEQYFKRAIEIDPDYLEAHANFAGTLLDTGNVDESIRHIDVVLRREPNNAIALTQLAQAYRLKDLYPESIEAARKAVKAAPKHAEPHLWMADSLRLSGKYNEAREEYNQYLALSDFDSKLAGQLNYYVLGSLIGFGKKKRAGTQEIWKELRSLAWFGVCDCERRLNNFDLAIRYCQTSLTYDPNDPYAHYALGLSYMRKADATGSLAELSPALKHFREMIDANPDMTEAKYARQNIETIQNALRGH